MDEEVVDETELLLVVVMVIDALLEVVVWLLGVEDVLEATVEEAIVVGAKLMVVEAADPVLLLGCEPD